MRTEDLERLLTEALHEGDVVPVDTTAAERRLAQRETERLSAGRRWTIAVVAAALVGLLVVASLALGGRLGDDERSHQIGPAPAPRFGLSPSGLPVGTLVGPVERTEPGATSTVRIAVRPDGTGLFNAGTVGDVEGDSVADYDVSFVAAGKGRAVMRNEGEAACFTKDVITLHFVVREGMVRIHDVSGSQPGCLVSPGLMADLPGTTLRIEPLPLELSPSGLPVGLLEGKVARSDGNVDVSTFRLQVLADGTGGLSMGGAAHGNAGGGGGGRIGYPVEIAPVSEGRAVLRYEGPVCSDPRALTLTFTIRGRSIVVDAAATSGCLVNADLAADLPGTVLRAVPAQ